MANQENKASAKTHKEEALKKPSKKAAKLANKSFTQPFQA